MPNACPGFDYRLPFLLGTILCLACLLPPASTESRSALPPPSLPRFLLMRPQIRDEGAIMLHVRCSRSMALNGGRAGGSRPCEGFSLGAPFWSGLWQPFFWRRCALCLVRLLRFCTGRRVWLATLHLIADCLNVHGLLFFSTATATPDGFGFLQILPMHDRFACQLSTVAERGRRWFG